MSRSKSPSRQAYIEAPLPVEREVRLLLRERTDPVILDIGACEGEDSVRYARLFPQGRVVAFEPVPKNVEAIERTLLATATSNVTIVPVALSGEDGEAILHLSSGRPPGAATNDAWDYGNKSSSLFKPDLHQKVHPWVKFEETITVPTLRLERACEQLGIDRVDFIHMDVQGAELEVLKGAGRLLERVESIWLEVEEVPLYFGQPLRGEVEHFLAGHGFRKWIDTVSSISGDQLWSRKQPPRTYAIGLMLHRLRTVGRRLLRRGTDLTR